MARPRRLTLLVALLALLVALAAGWEGLRWLDARHNREPLAGLDGPRLVEVSQGISLTGIAGQLAGEGLLRHPASWIREARHRGLATRLRAGEYRVEPGMTAHDLLNLMASGRVYLHSLTLPEGWTVRQALQAIEQHPSIKATMTGTDPAELSQVLGLEGRSPEGMLFPDTYLFAAGTTDRTLLRQAHQRLEEELASAWAARSPDLPLNNAYEALVLASIVEKETGIADERPLIAGVFINRLRRGMRLQTDPTVIYGLGESFDGNLRRSDLERDTPYNTYTRPGLPPTPIALVGREALRAATQPAATDALYFVATGLGDGRHRFASSLSQHNDNVARYIATMRGGSRMRAP